MNTEFNKWIVNISEINTLVKDTKIDFLDYYAFVNENILFSELEKKEERKYEFIRIENWGFFQNGTMDLGQEDFHKYFLSDVSPDELILLFTHEGIFNKCAFRFYEHEFYEFSDNYEKYFSMEFFQLSFYLVVYPRLNMMRFLDDDGGVHKITLL